MMTEIIEELTTIKKTNEITSNLVLSWTNRVKPQTVQKAILYRTKESREFGMLRKARQS